MLYTSISSSDSHCRFLASSPEPRRSKWPFEQHLKRWKVALAHECSIAQMVSWGWIAPRQRIRIPLELRRIASGPDNVFVEDIEEKLRWPARLLAERSPTPRRWSASDDGYAELWRHPLETQAIQAAGVTDLVVDPTAPWTPGKDIPHTQDAPAYLDYFAYWQVYVAVELESAARRYRFYTPETCAWTPEQHRSIVEQSEYSAEAIRSTWLKRESIFEWLACYRTLRARCMLEERLTDSPPSEIDAARELASNFGLTGDDIKEQVRETLLVMWSDSNRMSSPNKQSYQALLREDLTRALSFYVHVTGQHFDPLDKAWTYPDRQRRRWSELLEAIPLEFGLVRRTAARHLSFYVNPLPVEGTANLPASEPELTPLIDTYWDTEPSLRRVLFALHRLQRELRAPDRHTIFNTIPSHERIEQMLLCTLHTEKVITAYHKRVSQKNGYPEVRKSIKYLLDKALHSFTSLSSSQRASAVSEANELMHSKAQLHQGVPEAESLFITASELSLGSPRADLLTAAHVNFAISRNYMAHHDLRDDELAFGEGDKSAPGYILLSSTLTTLVVCLSLISMKAKGN